MRTIFLTGSGQTPIRLAVASRLRKVTVNLPADLLDDAVRITAKGLSSTIVEGLQEIQRRAKRSALRELRGKVGFELDLETTRR